MNTRHTPGPWFTTQNGYSTVYVEARLGGGMLQEVAACGPTEAWQQQEANARLIAAAPMLLEANIAEQAAQTYYDDIGSNEAYAAMRVLYGLGYSGENDARTPSEFASQLRRAAIAAATGAA